jgi:hypothetical protein
VHQSKLLGNGPLAPAAPRWRKFSATARLPQCQKKMRPATISRGALAILIFPNSHGLAHNCKSNLLAGYELPTGTLALTELIMNYGRLPCAVVFILMFAAKSFALPLPMTTFTYRRLPNFMPSTQVYALGTTIPCTRDHYASADYNLKKSLGTHTMP